jgi:predicted transcriptional regulator
MNPEDIIYPQSRFEVLRTLHRSPSAVSVREISYRSNVVLNNVQRAIKFLLKEKVISKKKGGRKIYYHISNLEVSKLVASILDAVEPFEIKAKADALKDRSIDLIDRLEERSRMIKHAKNTFRP